MLVHWLKTITFSGHPAGPPMEEPEAPPPDGSGGSFRRAPAIRLSDLDLAGGGAVIPPVLQLHTAVRLHGINLSEMYKYEPSTSHDTVMIYSEK